MSFTYRLIQLNSTHRNLRTREVLGDVMIPPRLGGFLIFQGEGLEEPGVRQIVTSEIQELDELTGGRVLFSTLNSTYLLEPLNVAEEVL